MTEDAELKLKAQGIRLFDVFVLAPLMFYGGVRLIRKGEGLLGGAIALGGVTTGVYNAQNWFRARELAAEELD